MADTRGTWSLSEAWAEKSAAEWVPIPGIWVTPAVTKVNTGYIGGGNGPASPAYACNKMNFDNSTTSNIGAIGPGANVKSAGCGGNTHGYWAGNASYSNNINKVVYATDSVGGAIPGVSLSAGRGYATGCNSDSYAYVCAGAASFNSYVSIVDRITATTDSCERIPGADLPSANKKQSAMATTAHPSAAYITGGVSPATTAVSKLTFSSETSAQVPSGALVAARGYHTATSNGTNSYFYGGGTNNNGSDCTSDILKTVYATDTNSLIPANLNGEWGRSGACGGTTFGVIAGGYRTPGNYTASADKFTYSNETRAAAPSMGLNGPKKESAGLSARNGFTGTTYDGTTARWLDDKTEPPNTSYGTAGNNGPSPVYKLDFTTMTAHSYMPGATQSPQRDRQATFSSADAGYMSGGTTWIPGSYAVHNIDKLPYATETTARLPSSNLSGYLWLHAGISDGTTQGWFWGGNNGGSTYNNTTITKITFSTDAASTAPSPMTAGNYNLKSTNSETAGYSFGGVTYSTNSQKLVFSTETTSMLTSLTPAYINAYGSATGDQTAGYMSAGHPAYSMIAKTTWATETSDNMPSSGCLSNARKNTFCMGNSTNGFWAGGSPGANGTIDNLTYATDTLANVPSWEPNAMAGGVYNGWGVGARNAGIPVVFPPTATPSPSTSLGGPPGIKNEGYLIQGIQGATSGSGRSGVYRLDYSTETWNSSAFANSSLTRKRGGAASTTTNAYIGGGTLGAADGNPTGGDMDKLTYATSTMSRMPGSDAGRITTSRGTDGQPAAGNQNLGYWGGGYGAPGAGRSHVDKFVYSSETASSLPNWPWSQNNLGVAVAMQTHAYLGGGPSETGTNFVKITFANDTYVSKNGWTTASSEKVYSGATSSPTKAYIVGGSNLERQMDVTTWASDTTSSSPSSKLASPGFSYAPGQGGNEAGYFTGGGNTGNNGTTTEKITFASDTSAIVPGAYFSSTSPSGINSYTTGGPNMNGVGSTSPNVI